jgi:TolA-binding protein
MRKSLLLLVALLSLVVIQACTEKLAEDVYFKQGYDLYNSGKFAEAITNFESIINYYPEGPNAPKALFMMGFIYSNHLNDLEKAKKYY